MTSPDAVYFEDLELGVETMTPGLTVTAAHAAVFSSVTGHPPDPARIDDLLPVALSSGLGWRVPGPPMVILAFMGFDWRFLRPVQVGDTIRVAIRIAAKRSMKDDGVLIEERRLLNQRDEVVQSGRNTLLIARRPAAAATSR